MKQTSQEEIERRRLINNLQTMRSAKVIKEERKKYKVEAECRRMGTELKDYEVYKLHKIDEHIIFFIMMGIYFALGIWAGGFL